MSEETPYRAFENPIVAKIAAGRAKLLEQRARDHEVREAWARILAAVDAAVRPRLRCEVRVSNGERWAMLVAPRANRVRMLCYEFCVDDLDKLVETMSFAENIETLEAEEQATYDGR